MSRCVNKRRLLLEKKIGHILRERRGTRMVFHTETAFAAFVFAAVTDLKN